MRILIIACLLIFSVQVFSTTQETDNSQNLVLKLIQLAVENGGIDNEQTILETKQLVEKLPKPKGGDRKKARVLNDKGLEYLKAGQSSLAIQSFQESLKTDPSDIEVVNNLGYAYLTENNSNAEQYLLQAIKMAPGRTSAWANLGQFYAKQDKNEFAVACFAHAFRFSQNRNKTIQFLNGLVDKDETLKAIVAKTLQLKLIKNFTTSTEISGNYNGKNDLITGELEIEDLGNNKVRFNLSVVGNERDSLGSACMGTLSDVTVPIVDNAIIFYGERACEINMKLEPNQIMVQENGKCSIYRGEHCSFEAVYTKKVLPTNQEAKLSQGDNTSETSKLDKEAQFNLGRMYRQGENVARDLEKAIYWYQQSANQGYTQAWIHLGQIYHDEESVQNLSLAFQYFLKAAEQDDTWSQNQVGLMYLEGKGILQNFKEAYKWFSKAAQTGNTDAVVNKDIARKKLEETINPILSPKIPSTYSGSGGGEVNVKGYHRKDGTYVRPHTRSSPGKGKR